jgi:DNA polymerase-1
LKTLKEFQPDYVAACFDVRGPTFRHKEFKEYKAKRKKAPDELYQQIPKIKEILRNFNIAIFEKQGFEADDLIATISEKAPKKQIFPKIETIILSGDMDTLQLVDKKTKVCALGGGIKETIIYNDEKVKERFGISPEQVVDFKALAGDPADNIPGATGIGKKIAVELLKEYKNIENLYQTIEKEQGWDIKPRIREILSKSKELVFLSQKLARANKNVDIDFNLEKCRWQGYNKEKIKEIFQQLNFYTLISRLP